MKELKDYVRTIPDFPAKGIMFRDITTVIQEPDGLKMSIDKMEELLKDVEFEAIAGIESRGFIFGMPLAYNLGKPFIPIRKKGKLPAETVSMSYELEYGTATIEMHKDAIKPGQRIILVDDLIATGGTVEAAAKLIETVGGVVEKMLFLIELPDLGGRKKLSGYDVLSVLSYEGD